MKPLLKRNLEQHKIFFILCVVFTLISTYFITQNCIDSDASSELILAEHLSKTGQLISKDWIYSTELRVFNTQLIFAPLFRLFQNWHTVRYIGAIVLQAILLLSFFAFIHLFKMDKKVFYIGGGIMLLPISVGYGRIVLYNSYYIPHIALSLVIAALTFNIAVAKQNRQTAIVKIAALLILSFLGGLGGVRQLMMTHAPVLLCIFILYFLDDLSCQTNASLHGKPQLKLLGTAIASAGMSFFGFVVNKFYLSKEFFFADYSVNQINVLSADRVRDVFYGFFHHFGFRDEINLISPLGILAVLSLALGCYAVAVSIREIFRYTKKSNNLISVAPYVLFACFILVMLVVFFIIGERYYFALYFTPLAVFSIPVLVGNAVNLPKELPLLNLKKLIACTAVVLVFINASVNSAYLINDKLFNQKYEGLRFNNVNQKEQISNAVEFLEENNYSLGYATFWNSNIMTEISNGKVKTINITLNGISGEISYYDWLTLKSNREIETDKYFLLLDKVESENFKKNQKFANSGIVYTDEYFVIYNLTDSI